MNQTTASSTLLYGASRTYKSTQLALVSEYIHRVTGGKRCRMVSTESSSAAVFEPYIDAGLIEPFWLGLRHFPRSALRKILRGEWPVGVKQPDGRMRLTFQQTPPGEWAKIGAYLFEGLTTFAELALIDLVSKGRKINEEVVGLYEDKKGYEAEWLGGEDVKLGAAARSHFGAVQQDILFILKEGPKSLFDISSRNVQHVFWTAHEAKGVDEQKDTVYGPATVGKAITNMIQKEVGLLMHHQECPATDAKGNVAPGRMAVRAYYRSHPDPDNSSITWQAGPRNAPDAKVARALDQKFGPGGYITLSLDPAMGLVQFLEFHHEIMQTAADDIRRRLSTTTTTTNPSTSTTPTTTPATATAK